MQPSILWNDIGAPAAQNFPDLFARYYNAVPEGVIDDRWNQELHEVTWFQRMGSDADDDFLRRFHHAGIRHL